jgi:phosphatidylglycerophosphate synthase
MTQQTYQPTDRRPLASRQQPFWQKTAAMLASAGASPNKISIAGLFCGIAAGVCLVFTAHVDTWRRIFWLAAAGGTQLRLAANLLDGMVAVASGRASAVGELYNEIPDRISDAAILIGAGYAAGGNPIAGYVAACLAIMTAYIRAVGKAAGVSNLFLGPMAKPHRMFVITVACLYMALSPRSWQFSWNGQGVMAVALWIICLGAVITCVRRLVRIARHLGEPQG